jgi:hypothetical protein
MFKFIVRKHEQDFARKFGFTSVEQMYIFNSFFVGLTDVRYETLANLSDKDKRQLSRMLSSTTQFIKDIYFIDMLSKEDKARISKLCENEFAVPFMLDFIENLLYMQYVIKQLSKENIDKYEEDVLKHFMVSKNVNPTIISMIMVFLQSNYNVVKSNTIVKESKEQPKLEPKEEPKLEEVPVEKPKAKRGRKKKE